MPGIKMQFFDKLTILTISKPFVNILPEMRQKYAKNHISAFKVQLIA
jgi:hypothetical protein